ncbi:DUF4349 domain-containing protein [uncultured Hymenobacter sp.]|uniref:DUF4349 domain-containing protein n=1 Tax=uncultured Hymenobacter sp. TaxID=170016 RepID=UPI0035CC2277
MSLALLCAGCGQQRDQPSATLSRQEALMEPPSSEEPAEAVAAADDQAAPVPAPPTPTGTPAVAPAARLLVYHAEVRVKAGSLPQASARLDSLVRRSGGYVSAATESRENGEWRSETTIRVPPARFQPLLTGLNGLGTVEEKKLSTDDVTAEHADVAARLRTKRAVEARYVALLAKAQRIKDVLEIEEKIGATREEIEATESRLKTLNEEVSYSTITLNLYQPIAQTLPDAPVVSLGSRVVEAFYGGWQLLTALLVGVVAIWPLLLLGALGGLAWRARKTRSARLAASARGQE